MDTEFQGFQFMRLQVQILVSLLHFIIIIFIIVFFTYILYFRQGEAVPAEAPSEIYDIITKEVSYS